MCRKMNISVTGLEHINPHETYIIASNHVHELDSFFIFGSIPDTLIPSPIYFAVREKQFYWDKGIRGRFYGFILKYLGGIEVKTKQDSLEVAVKNLIDAVNKNKYVHIFPEGRITKTGEIGPARPGIGQLALSTGKKILPITIKNGFKSIPFAKSAIRITVHKPFLPEKTSSAEDISITVLDIISRV